MNFTGKMKKLKFAEQVPAVIRCAQLISAGAIPVGIPSDGSQQECLQDI